VILVMPSFDVDVSQQANAGTEDKAFLLLSLSEFAQHGTVFIILYGTTSLFHLWRCCRQKTTVLTTYCTSK
jgi:hypothetical protein